mgnify:CR=1 FL=1
MSEQGNERLYARVRAAADRGTLHHALLLTGNTGSGKHDLARTIAAALECSAPSGKPCGLCPGCRKVFADIHPDVIHVRDDEHKTIPVDAMRALCADVYIRTNEGARKVYLFDDCGQLDQRCQDILLKTVEEGPRYAAFLFLSENAAAILPTIRSRCVELKLRGGTDEAGENSAMVDRAMELGDYLCQMREDVLVGYLCSLESAKLKRTDLAAFFAAARELCAAALLRQYGAKAPEMYAEMAEKLAKSLTKEQLSRIIELLQTYREQSEFNVGVGHMLGAFAAELSALLSAK